MMRSGMKSLAKLLRGRKRYKRGLRHVRAARFSIESLESRSLLTGSTFTINLANQTGLNPSQFAIYALGYSSASQLVLQANGTFVSFSGAAGQIPSYKVGSGAGDLSTITLSQDQAVTGAIVYFFVVPLPVATTPFLTYANGGSTVIQPQNPPSNQLPSGQGSFVYQFIEFTQPLNGLPTVDVSEVDGFIMPINVTVNNDMQVGQPLYQSGQTPVENRADIFTEYTNFVANISSPTLRQAYQDLIINSTTVAGQPIGILNPGIQLASGAHPNSPLNTLWDTDLTTLFTTSGRLIGMMGDDSAYYQGTPTQLGSGQWVLHFVGYTDAACTLPNGNVYNIYSPKTPDPSGSYQTNETSGEMVFANDGVFADSSSNVVISGPSYVALGLERDIVSALNRGVALLGQTDGVSGHSSVYWGTETNWYPSTQTYNYFSWFMHVGQISGQSIFVPPTSTPAIAPPVPATDAQGNVMGQAYGFGYDETPSHPAPPSGYSQFPNVPSKFDPVPSGTSTINITFGPWTSTRPSGPTSTHYFSVGTGPGQASTVNVYGIDQQGHRTLVTTLHPFASSFTGGVNLATGDVNGDGTDDILVSAGPFGQTNVKVYNGKTFAVLYSFRAFPEKAAQSAHIATFVASADVNNDGYDDIITGAGAVYTPLVRVYSGKDGSLLKQFTAFGNGFRGGVRVAAGDIDKDGFAEIVVGTGTGSYVRVFNGHTYAPKFGFDPFKGLPNHDGVFVALADVQGDDVLDIIVGNGPNLPAQARVFSAADGHYVDRVFLNAHIRAGTPVGAFDFDGDGKDEVLTGHSPGPLAEVDIWKYDTSTHHWLDDDNFLVFNNKRGESIG